MKKLALFLLLAACVEAVEKAPGTENLIPIHDEPVGCRLLYRLEVDALTRDKNDAVQFLENKIAAEQRPGNAYWITSIRTSPREGVVFGREHSYIVAANVYKCPEHIRISTVSNVEQASEYQFKRR